MSNTTSKFKAIKTKIDGITFDSVFESQVYTILKEVAPNAAINAHYPFTILEKTDKTIWSRGLPSINWRIDFRLKQERNHEFFIEAKGAVLPEFKLKLQLFQRFHSDSVPFLYLVFADTNKELDKLAKQLRLPRTNLLNLSDLKRLNF